LFGNKGMGDQPGSMGSWQNLLRAQSGESLRSLLRTTGTCFTQEVALPPSALKSIGSSHC